MKIIFYLGHPAHYHLFKYPIKFLKEKNHDIIILIKKKDILEELLKNDGLNYINILHKGRRDGKIGITWGLLKRELVLIKIAKKFRPHIMVGTSSEITHIGKLLNINSLVVNEDDFDVVPLFSKLTYPFADCILAPTSCQIGKWNYKSISYNGYHELTYLHMKYFIPDNQIIKTFNHKLKRYFILRFAKLTAHHDAGKTGITTEVAEKIVKILEPYGKIYITSERVLEPQFEKYRININPLDIHHALYYADLYIGDSQTMAAEAAVLGTPSIRFNDFVGKIGYLEELEHKYELTFGIKTSEPQRLFDKIDELIKTPGLKEEWQKRRQKMLSEKIDVTAFMVWFIENYPKSVKIMKENPNYQYQFK